MNNQYGMTESEVEWPDAGAPRFVLHLTDGLGPSDPIECPWYSGPFDDKAPRTLYGPTDAPGWYLFESHHDGPKLLAFETEEDRAGRLAQETTP